MPYVSIPMGKNHKPVSRFFGMNHLAVNKMPMIGSINRDRFDHFWLIGLSMYVCVCVCVRAFRISKYWQFG